MITAWLAITVATVVSRTTGHSAQLGNIRKKGFSIAAGLAEHQRALSQVVERERGERHAEPGGLDRLAAEVSEVGIEGFRAGDGEEHEAQHREPDEAVVEEKCRRRSPD